MKYIFIIIFAFAAITSVFGQQQQNQPQEVLVKVQTVAAPTNNTPIVAKANEWVEFGKNVGTAMDAGLTSLTDHAEKFSKTDVGRFTMAVIAWKVAGRDAFDITRYVVDRLVCVPIGLGLLAILISVYLSIMYKMVLQRRVVAERSGPFWNRTYKYEIVKNNDYYTGERALYAFLSTLATFLIGLAITFNLIA